MAQGTDAIAAKLIERGSTFHALPCNRLVCSLGSATHGNAMVKHEVLALEQASFRILF